MLDQHHGAPRVVADPLQHRPERLDLLLLDPRRRLVEQQDLRLQGQDRRELQEPHRPVGQLGGIGVGPRPEVDHRQDVVDALARVLLVASPRRQAQHRGQRVRGQMAVLCDEQVLEQREVL